MADGAPPVLLSALARAFDTILKKDIAKEPPEEKKKDKKSKKSKKGKKKDEDKKPVKEMEEKHVLREGKNSLITYPNASSFSVFSHIRHFVLQSSLCDTFNSRLSHGGGGGPGEEEVAGGEEQEADEARKGESKIPVVVGLGVRGLFSIVRDVWRSQPELCLRALREFLNILQGQNPAGLKNEPAETTAALFELLMQMVVEEVPADSSVVLELSSVASACLLSLVVSLGDTGKMLSAVAAMLTAPTQLSEAIVQIPQIFYSLQASVQAVLLGAVVETQWSTSGIPSKSMVETWPLPLPLSADGRGSAAVTSDGRFLYLHGPFGLLKIGSGYGNTKKGFIYQAEKSFYSEERVWLGHASGKLYLYPLGRGEDTISVISTETLAVENVLELEADSVGAQCLFSDGESLGQIKAKKEQKGFVVRKFTTLCSPLPCVEEKPLQLSQKSVLCMGQAKYDSVEAIHTLYQDNSGDVDSVMASRSFAAVKTTGGKLLYTGSGVVFGLTARDVAKGEWKELELPDNSTAVKHCSCDNAGTFCLLVTDKGHAYFGGINKKGESGQAVGGRQHPKPLKLKRLAKLKDVEVVSSACGSHATALITQDGKLYMFGTFEDDITDKSTGIVTGLLGVPVSQVAMGRSHTCLLTQHGTIYTFGNNTYGQCGRNFIPPKENAEGSRGEEEEGEDSESEEEDTVCPAGEHKWSHNVCMMCKSCGFCTGYGPGCCNEGMPGRSSGQECGCGSGDSGCSQCGLCKVCAGEKDRWGGSGGGGGGGGLFDDTFGDEYERAVEVREKLVRKKKEKKKKKKKKDKEETKSEKDGMFLQLLFGESSVDRQDSTQSGVSAEEGGGAGPAEPVPDTKKPASVPLPDQLTAMQVDCGTFHTAVLLHSGELYVFGNGNHGQLGQGNSKLSGEPVAVTLPSPATQVACGDNHTVVLLDSGEVYTFGKHQEGQLGRQKLEADDDESWFMVPQPVVGVGARCKASWIGARGNQTFIVVDELLVSKSSLSNCTVFANTEMIGLIPPTTEGLAKPNILMINREEMRAKKFDGEDQQNLAGCTVCIDPEYNILWSFSSESNKMACFNPVASNIDNSAGTILSSTICLPRSKEAHTSRSHLALNLLSCLSTLATSPPLSMEAIAGSRLFKLDKDEFNSVLRFSSHGGGWGYSASSVEAIRFSPDTDVLLGGFGLYGGRGTYNAEIKVFDLGEAGDANDVEGTMLASHTEIGYTCERQQTCRVLFDKPVLLTADHWYVAYAAVSSPSGASSDAGSSGQSEVQGPDKVVFKIKPSKRSNNGTDIGSGQIPEFLYCFPEMEQEDGNQIELLDREFSSSVSAVGLNAVLRLLDWSWSRLSQISLEDPQSAAYDSQHLAIVATATLGLLKTYIRKAFPQQGRISHPGLDCHELAEAVFEARSLLRIILSSHRPVLEQPEEKGSPICLVLDACCDTFRACFHAFYPTTPLKWFALCQHIQLLDPHDVVSGVPMENLLSTILEALADPTVSYIGLGYDTDVSINAAIYNSEPEQRFPVLSEYIQLKTLEENEGGQLLGFNAVAAKLLSVVAAPIHTALVSKPGQVHSSLVVSRAGKLLQSRISELALCIAYPESAAVSGLPVVRAEKKEKVVESSLRFSTKESGHPSLATTGVAFSVNKPIVLHGFTVYSCVEQSSKYEITLHQQTEQLAVREGTFSHSDVYGEGFVNLKFKEPVKLEAEVVYTARTELSGSLFDIGVEGKTSLAGPGGAVFTLHHTGLAESNPECGPVARFLYSGSVVSAPQNVLQLSVHLASTLLDVTVGFLERLLSGELTGEVLHSLGSSFLFSTLLPTTLAQLGPVACKQAKYAVEVLDLVKRALPIVSVAAKRAQVSSAEGSSGTYSDARHLHYATVESDHPYKQCTVSHYRVEFDAKVQWMSLEFDPRTGFSQSEDKLGELLIPRQGAPNFSSSTHSKPPVSTPPLVGLCNDDLHADWERYALHSPPGLVLLPGNEVHISVNTDTEYEKKDANNRFGLKCQVVGYEQTIHTADSLVFLEKELVALGAMCAASLLKEDTALPFTEELSVSGAAVDIEKADMRMVQASAQEVLGKHCQVLGRGLMAETPSIHQVLGGDIPVITGSNEQLFLKDFIESKSGTPGGRLARWLQPDRAVDPDASELQFPSGPVHSGLPSQFTVLTKDQDGKAVHVEGMKVEVKAVWLGRKDGKEGPTHRDKMVDSVMGVRKPTFKRSYCPTRLNASCLYHSITMMMPYSDYSLEELRLFAPKVKRSAENMPLKCNKDGSYTAAWNPSTSGSYIIQVFIDGRHTGQEKSLEVVDAELAEEPEPVNSSSAEQGEPTVVPAAPEGSEPQVCKPKMKLFTGKAAPGLRIRSEPSFIAVPLGVIKPGDYFTYTEEVENDAGTWVVLSFEAMDKYKCRDSSTGAFALAYSKEKQQNFLDDMEPPPEVIEEYQKHTQAAASAPKQKASSKQRQGGCGAYSVVQCGKAGHNVRSKPGMKGAPVGRLLKGNKIEASEELENDDGIWLKLSKVSLKKYCDTDSDAWTLAVGPSGRIFLTREGDESYQSQVVDTSSSVSKPNAYPTAASVFGTAAQPSIFSTSSAFQFSSTKPTKLQFGLEAPHGVFKFGKVADGKSAEGFQPKSDSDSSTEKRAFSIGSVDVPGRLFRSLSHKRGRHHTSHSRSPSPEDKQEAESPAGEEKEQLVKPPDSDPQPPSLQYATIKQALSPAIAECQRAVFAAFLWQEGLVYDAMASASYLKFHPELLKEMGLDPKSKVARENSVEQKQATAEEVGGEQTSPTSKDQELAKESKAASSPGDKEAHPNIPPSSAVPDLTDLASRILSLPPTLNHLVTFWDEISCKVIDNSTLPFPPPKVPTLTQELQRRYEEERKEVEKRKKEKDNKAPQAGGGGGGFTDCELCDQGFPDPITYHMKEAHPGCGKHASGWGYNSRGTFCSGWAGNCGDGGRGGSTWYLMCKDCHSKYLSMKDEVQKKAVKTVPLPKMKTRKPGKPRCLPVITAVQGMIQNAKFLLEISRTCDSAPHTPSGLKPPIDLPHVGPSDLGRQLSVPASTPSSDQPSDEGKKQVSFDVAAPVFEKAPTERPSFLRSVSVAVGGGPKQSQSDVAREDQIKRQHTTDESTPISPIDIGSLMVKPSRNLRKLMYDRSRKSPDSKETGYHKVLAFVLRYHDLDGVRVTMKQFMRVAGIRTNAMEFLEWLLNKVQDASIVHDVLWQFNCALLEHPVQQMALKLKAERNKEKGQKNTNSSDPDDCFLGRHPLSGLDGAGLVLSTLRKQFHSFLQTIANLMPQLPVGSAVQLEAMKCYCLRFLPQDHHFLLQSNVFANISKALSGAEDSDTQDKGSAKVKGIKVSVMENVLSQGRLKVSSNDAMSNSLTDGSTETFWESRDEPRGRARQLTVTFEKERKLFAVCVHIDNQKDAGQRVDSLSLWVGQDEDKLQEVDKAKLSILHSGWKMLMIANDNSVSVLRIEAKGQQNNIRVRQLQVLGYPDRYLEASLPAVLAQRKACEAEALRVFRLLTSEVFGGLLTALPSESSDDSGSGAPAEGEKEGEVREHVVDILFSQGKLSGLQKQVCMHIVQSVHTEAEHMREEWDKPPVVKLARQASTSDTSAGDLPKSSDTYCYELLSMLIGLSQSDVGCSFLADQQKLLMDLFTLLHVASIRIQLQICSLLRKILPVVGPKLLAPMLGVLILPPLGYSAIAEAVNSAATINNLGILDCLLAAIAKALSVQVKAKGRSSNLLQVLTGEGGVSALTLATLVNPKPVPGETTVKSQRWYLKGSISHEVANEVVKLLKDMTNGSFGGQWQGYTKSAIGQAVLHLTKLHEDARVPVPGMYSQTLWLCLAALCVIDEEHAEALSSGQWLGQDGKPKIKPLCDNHDDGETQALILCDKCGNLCGECDRVLHYRTVTNDHQRQVFKEEEEAVKVELHEGCGRIKLYWTMALTDYRTLKGMIEFKESGSSGGKGACRFCGTTSNTVLLGIGNICADPECQSRARTVCDKNLSCGHVCCGVQGEETCLPCLHGCASDNASLKQDADDMCMICYTEGLSCASCIQLECGHVFHYHCCRDALTKRWSGPRITFRFMFCSICVNTSIAHPKLADVLEPVEALYEDTKRKCLLRLQYENQMKCEAITSAKSKFYEKPLEYGMSKYAYYVCYSCQKAYYGGEANCAEQVGTSDDFDPTELVCPACSNVGGAVQVCPKHGTDFLEYKCRYCCSVAVYFCFGTTHFCTPCHDDFQRLTGMAKSELPQCPVGPCAKPLEGTECPLHVKHPPTGDEFALGCGVCRNAQTF